MRVLAPVYPYGVKYSPTAATFFAPKNALKNCTTECTTQPAINAVSRVPLLNIATTARVYPKNTLSRVLTLLFANVKI